MSAIDRLYDINNRTTKKSVNIDDSLYKKLIHFTQNKFDATVSDLINVAIEDYSAKGNPTFYGKPEKARRCGNVRRRGFGGFGTVAEGTGL